MNLPPKPRSRSDRVSLWQYARLFRRDILSAQPERLYRAKMAEFRTPFFRSFMINQPDLIAEVLKHRPQDFPKSERVSAGLRPLLGNSVFLSNGETREHQRRIIDPAFEGGRLRRVFPAMIKAADAMAHRLDAASDPWIEIEAETSHVAADVMFRALFSIPIEEKIANAVFQAFRTFQRSQPLLNIAAFVPRARLLSQLFRRDTKTSAGQIRFLLKTLIRQRRAALAAGTAPDDLDTKKMTTVDPQTGNTFDDAETIDQIAIFFLAGHETSASALAWAFYLLATHPVWQDRLSAEAWSLDEDDFGSVAKLKISRDVFRETLRLYPPVPMMVRQARCPETFRNRRVQRGAQVVISPWHLHRNPRLWQDVDAFDPGRWQSSDATAGPKDAYLPFSLGPRVCPGAGFAMIEGPLILSRILREYRVTADPNRVPVPIAHLTVRSDTGIWLNVTRR